MEGSPDLRRELGTWSWKQNSDGDVLQVVADGNDHGIDALVYRVYRHPGAISEAALSAMGSDREPVRRSIFTGSVKSLQEA